MTVVMMMVMCLSSHIDYRCRHCQHRRILILNELCDSFTDDPEEQNEPYNYEYLHIRSLSFLQRGPHIAVEPPCAVYKLLYNVVIRLSVGNHNNGRSLISGQLAA